jgi:hypothetical protein
MQLKNQVTEVSTIAQKQVDSVNIVHHSCQVKVLWPADELDEINEEEEHEWEK